MFYKVVDKSTMDQMVAKEFSNSYSRDGNDARRKAMAFTQVLFELCQGGCTFVGETTYGFVFAENFTEE